MEKGDWLKMNVVRLQWLQPKFLAVWKGTDLPYKLADAAAVAEHTDVYVFGGVSEDADGVIIPMKEPGSSFTRVNSLPVTLSVTSV